MRKPNTILIFSLFVNNVRMAGPIGMGQAPIVYSNLGKMTVPDENQSFGTWFLHSD